MKKETGKTTQQFLDAIRTEMQAGIAGAEITVEKEAGGPPTDPPVNIEIAGDDFDAIAKTSIDLLNYLDTNKIYGVEKLKADIDLINPEITINVDREKAMREGLFTGQIGMEIRNAVFGKEASKLKDGEDEYKIQIRYTDLQRNNIS